ncbi:MAG: hypothetical protein HYW49_03015 [Deltaproteobacteria bacterium]|nr:hypothetical protein [Deltaproteobacteria bacterium]
MKKKIARTSQVVGALAVFSSLITACEPQNRAAGGTPANMPGAPDTGVTQPKILGILPGARANNNFPKLVGIAETGSSVYVYTDGSCSGAPAATGTAQAFKATGITVTVADDSVTVFSVKSIGSLSTVTSNCVGTVTYTEDSTAPAAPASFSITPANGSTSTVTTPAISGTGAENGTTISLYSNAGCGSLLATAVSSSGAFSFSGFTVSGDGLRVFYYKIADSSGNTSACTNTARSYTLDTTAPTAPASWAMSSPNSGATTGDTTPMISGNAAEDAAVVKVYSNSNCSTLLNSGTVAAGAFSIGAFTVPAGNGLKTFYYKIQDTQGNSTACATTGLSYTLDGTAATVTNVSSTNANGTYALGQTIAVTVTFSKAVTVTGTPQLTLETGTSDAVVSLSGSSSNTLTFNYTVSAGHSSANLNYLSTTSLALNGGTIKDTDGNNATLTLPALTSANSLGGNKNIVVSTAAVLSFIAGSTSPTPPNPDPFGTQSTNVGPHTYTLKNTGSGSTSTAITLSLIGSSSPWRITGGACLSNPSPPPPATTITTDKTLALNATCTVEVTFLAATHIEGSYPAALRASAASGGTATHNMTGTVQCPTTPVVFWSNDSWIVPGGCTDIEVKAWGGGGGADCCYPDAKGGGGGYATAYKHLAPGDALQIYVGGAGHPAEGNTTVAGCGTGGNSGGAGGTNGGGAGGGACAWDGASGGGGFSGFYQTGGLYPCGSYPNNPCLIAGGGGGAASNDVINQSGGQNGGAGGGATGTAGSYYYNVNYPEYGRGGGGATQSSGGSGGSGGTASSANNITNGFGTGNFDAGGSNGQAGGFLAGGNGAAGYSGGYYGGNSSGGGGGGGVFGGGGGGSGAYACSAVTWNGTCGGDGCSMGEDPQMPIDFSCSYYFGRAGGGGGGGSSYAPSFTNYLKGSTTAAVGTVAGNNTDSDLDGTLWNGSAHAAGSSGAQGLVVIHPHGSAPSGGYP